MYVTFAKKSDFLFRLLPFSDPLQIDGPIPNYPSSWSLNLRCSKASIKKGILQPECPFKKSLDLKFIREALL
jgi:hypothetical protein